MRTESQPTQNELEKERDLERVHQNVIAESRKLTLEQMQELEKEIRRLQESNQKK